MKIRSSLIRQSAVLPQKRGDARLLLGRAHAEVGGEEERARHVFGHVGGCARVADALDHAAPHDDVRLQQLHRRQHHGRVEMVDRGREPRRVAAVLDQRLVLEEGALQRQRPAFADQPHIGQRLLDAEAAGRAAHQEDEVQIAVAHFVDAPAVGRAAETCAERRNFGETGGEARHVERPVAVGNGDGVVVSAQGSVALPAVGAPDHNRSPAPDGSRSRSQHREHPAPEEYKKTNFLPCATRTKHVHRPHCIGSVRME